ncbi:MAG: nitroreductase family protein [Chloroflexota bacterium]|jgi:nitroreductase
MELEEAIKTRRSIRKYQDKDVPLDVIMKAINLACWAPNGGNYQSWKFFVVKNRALINRMADTLQEKMDRMCQWPEVGEFGETFQRYSRNACFFRNAGALIAVGHGEYQSAADKVLKRRGPADPEAREMIENRAAVASKIQTVGGLVATLLLALHQEGLGACWMAGPMLIRREMEKMLGVPDDIRLFALVPVGYPAETPAPGPRKALEEIVTILE